MARLGELLDRLEQLLMEMEQLDEPVRGRLFEVLDGIDALHRLALDRLASQLRADELRRVVDGDPAVAWLFEAYDIRPPEPPTATPVDIGPTRRA